MNSVTAVPGRLVRQDDLGFRGAVGLADDAGQGGERLCVVQTGAAQRGVQIRGRDDRAGLTTEPLGAVGGFGLCQLGFRYSVANPGAGRRARMDFDADLVGVVSHLG